MNEHIDFKIDNRTVVHLPSEELCYGFCKLLQELGARWWDGDRYTTDCDFWEGLEDDTCFDVHEGSFEHIKYFEKEGYKIISAQEFFKLHEDATFKIELKDTITDFNNLTEQLKTIYKHYGNHIIANNTVDAGMAIVTSLSGAIHDLRKIKETLNKI